ncbi:SIR2 family protein [Streptosporangiaceae bacterium NEAU-GS5]|nr:SIR2 family protein [Streptosporangiaceae bacterium NEAU-GS5]
MSREVVPAMQEMSDADWKRLARQLRKGDCTPFLGAGACGSSIPLGAELSERLAKEWSYPFSDRHNLTRVAQYGVMRERDPTSVKEMIGEHIGGGVTPDFDDPLEPHGMLADFPLPVYLTTNYDDFIARSLRRVNKSPTVVTCPWNDLTVAPNAPQRLIRNPTVQRPLVYHLHGNLQDHRSMAVTEDDYLEFLTNLMIDRALARQRMLPPPVLAAMTLHPLLFIGYSLQDWTFRVLFKGLLRAVPGINQRRSVSVQLAPDANGHDVDQEKVQQILATYYSQQWNISIFWGTAAEFCAELTRWMRQNP